MIPVLARRRAFLLVDAAPIVAIVAGYRAAVAASAGFGWMPSPWGNDDEAGQPFVRKVLGPRPVYDPLADRGLFGLADRVPDSASIEEDGFICALPSLQLPLTLRGTVQASGGGGRPCVVIERHDGEGGAGRVATYFIGQEVFEGYRLRGVLKNAALLKRPDESWLYTVRYGGEGP